MTDERGAVGVIVALLMVPLIGFAAISIDVAAMWSERQELQSGADAGALAVAQDCGRGDCGDPNGTAQRLAEANVDAGGASASVTAAGAGTVSVTTSGVRNHFFAPVLGINSSTIVARASAGWGAPTGGQAELPLAISWCDYQAQTGGAPSGGAAATILLTGGLAPADPLVGPDVTDPAVAPARPQGLPAADSVPAAPGTSCTGPRGTSVPSGFGWLSGSDGCRTSSSIAAGAAGAAGGSLPSGCSSAELSAAQGKTVLLPIFDQSAGAAGRYRVYGYAAFTLTGYHFAGQPGWRSPCSGTDSCIAGSFSRWTELSDHFDYDDGAPQLGAAVVSLTS